MSTKIYNGRVMQGSLHTVYAKLLRLKKNKLRPLWLDQWRRTYTELAVSKIDDARMKDETVYGAVSGIVIEAVDAHFEIKRTGHRNPMFDNSSEIWLFPNYKDDKVYAIINSEFRGATDLLDAQRWIKDYGYWNNTDQPEGISNAAWEQRRRVWDRLLPGAGTPSERCLTLELTPLYPPFDFELGDRALFERHIASPAQRVARVAANIHRSEHYQRLMELPEHKDDKGFQTFFAAEKAAKEAPERRKEIAQMVEAKLQPLTPADLFLQRGAKEEDTDA